MKTVNCLARQRQDCALASRLARRARFAVYFSPSVFIRLPSSSRSWGQR